MVTVIYTKPHKTNQANVWLIGWSKSNFEKVKCNIFHRGSFESAIADIDSRDCKKYLKR